MAYSKMRVQKNFSQTKGQWWSSLHIRASPNDSYYMAFERIMILIDGHRESLVLDFDLRLFSVGDLD